MVLLTKTLKMVLLMAKADNSHLAMAEKAFNQRLREMALSLAHQNHDSETMTIKRAESYYAFLNKND